MKRVSAYQATDGQVFTARGDCKTHQKNINTVMALRNLADDFEKQIADSPDYTNIGDPFIALAGVEFVTFIAANIDRVRAALEGKVQDDTEGNSATSEASSAS